MKLLLTPWYNKFMNLVRNVREELFIVAPYIGPSIIEEIINNFRGKRLRVLAKVDAYDSSGRLNLKSFDLFFKNKLNIDIQIRLIRNLHAKVLVFDNKKAIITSSNLTLAGLTNNIELGVLITDENYIREHLLPILEYYWSQGNLVTEKDIDKIAKEIEKIRIMQPVIVETKNIKEAPKLSLEIFGARVSPIGEDEAPKKLSKRRIAKEIALKLMEKELSKEEILRILESYGSPKKTILIDAFQYSFDSDSPFETASIYYRNMLKVLPTFQREFSRTKARMFCNLILRKGNVSKYGIEIESLLDYWKYQSMFVSAFNMKPPRSEKVLQVMKEDNNLSRLVNNPKYIYRVIRIFLPLAAASKSVSHELRELLELLLVKVHHKKQKVTPYKIKDILDIEKEIIEALEQLDQIQRYHQTAH